MSQYEALTTLKDQRRAERAAQRDAARAEVVANMRPHAAYILHFEQFMESLSPSDVKDYKIEILFS